MTRTWTGTGRPTLDAVLLGHLPYLVLAQIAQHHLIAERMRIEELREVPPEVEPHNADPESQGQILHHLAGDSHLPRPASKTREYSLRAGAVQVEADLPQPA